MMSKNTYMKCNADPPLKPCHKCGAEINANWTIRRLQKEKAELEAQIDRVDIIITRMETLPQDTVYSRGIAYEFRSALEGE